MQLSSESGLDFAIVLGRTGLSSVLPLQHSHARGYIVGYFNWIASMNPAEFEDNRRAMIVSQLRTNGISEGWITAAMGKLPREAFVPADRAAAAYMDRSVDLGHGRYLNPPLATALMLSHGEVSADDNALIIGAGTGYLAALLAGKVSEVTAVEDNAALAQQAKANLKDSKATVVEGPLAQGWQGSAPYSLIIIDGAIEELPQAIIDQLAEGGRIVAGQSEGAVTRLAVGDRHGDNVAPWPIADTEIARLPGFERAKEFVF